MTTEPPYPEARRTYRILGVVHAALFGLGITVVGIREGDVVAGLVVGIVAIVLTLAFFWPIADNHYQGNVPGKPGALVVEDD